MERILYFLRRWWWAIVILVALVIIGLFFLFRDKPKITLYQSFPTANNIRFPDIKDENSIRFFTGTSFAELDLKSKGSKSLMREFRLPTVNQVYWGNDFALFKASGLASDNELYPGSTRNTTLTLWYIADFASNKIVPVVSDEKGLGAQISDAKLSSEKEVVYARNFSGVEKVFVNNKEVLSFNTSSPVSVFGKSGDTLLLSVGDEIKTYQKTSSGAFQESRVTKIANVGGVLSDDAKTAVFKKPRAVKPSSSKEAEIPSYDLVKLDMSSGKTKVLTKEFSGVFSLNKNILVFMSSNSKQKTYDLSFFDLGTQELIGADVKYGKNFASVIQSVSLVNPETKKLFFVDEASSLVVIDPNKQFVEAFEPPVQVAFEAKFTKTPNGYMEYDLYSSRLKIFVEIIEPFETSQKTVMAFIVSKGVDPNQINKSWNLNTGEID